MNQKLSHASVKMTATIRDAMESLEKSSAQIVLVVDDLKHLVGTLTDGDLRRAILHGATLETAISAFVQRHFISVGATAGRAEVLEVMQARQIKQVPVVDGDGHLLGLHLLTELLGAVERPNWALIMAGGQGTRLRPLTETIPKPMLPVAGRPILERILLHLVGHGIRRVFISVNYLADQIERHFEDGKRFGCSIEYLREERPLGTGGALSLLPEAPSHSMLVLNGDLVTQFDVGALFELHRGNNATVGVHQYTHTIPFGVAEVSDGRLVGLREKPTMAWNTLAGIYVLEPGVIARVPKQSEFTLPELIATCLERNEPVGAFLIQGEWIDVGRAKELMQARGVVQKP
jgi:dTDP-glucose pyrophosphorylase